MTNHIKVTIELPWDYSSLHVYINIVIYIYTF